MAQMTMSLSEARNTDAPHSAPRKAGEKKAGEARTGDHKIDDRKLGEQRHGHQTVRVDFEALLAASEAPASHEVKEQGRGGGMPEQTEAGPAVPQLAATFTQILHWPPSVDQGSTAAPSRQSSLAVSATADVPTHTAGPTPLLPEPAALGRSDANPGHPHQGLRPIRQGDPNAVGPPAPDSSDDPTEDVPGARSESRPQPLQFLEKRSDGATGEPRKPLVPPRANRHSEPTAEPTPPDMPRQGQPAAVLQATPAVIPPDLPPARQVLSLLETPASPLRVLSAPLPDQQLQGGGLKVLRMTLRPEALGEVDVTLRRQGDEMRIQITVGKQEAADALRADLGLLHERVGALLGQDGSHTIAILVQPADPQPPAAGTVPRPQGAETGTTFTGSPGHRDSDRQPPRKQDSPSLAGRHDTHETPPLRPAAPGLVV